MVARLHVQEGPKRGVRPYIHQLVRVLHGIFFLDRKLIQVDEIYAHAVVLAVLPLFHQHHLAGETGCGCPPNYTCLQQVIKLPGHPLPLIGWQWCGFLVHLPLTLQIQREWELWHQPHVMLLTGQERLKFK